MSQAMLKLSACPIRHRSHADVSRPGVSLAVTDIAFMKNTVSQNDIKVPTLLRINHPKLSQLFRCSDTQDRKPRR